MRPDFGRHAVDDGDVYLLCSDGLWGEVPDADIARELQGPSAKRVIAWWRWRAGTVEATM